MISANALIYLVAYMVPAFIGFLALILYTHLLSPAEYGIYVIGSSIAAIISAVFFSWIRQSVLRYQASFPKLDFRTEAIVAYGGTAVLIACLTPVAMLIARPGIGFGVLVASVFLSLSFTAFEISQDFSRAKLNPLRFATVSLIRSTLGLLLGYLAIRLGFGGLGLLIGIGASFLIANSWSFPRSADKPLWVLSANHLAQFARYGLPFSLGALAFSLHSVLDRLGVAYLLGESGVGYYGLSADLTRQLIGILAASVASSMFPVVFRTLAEIGPVAARARLKEGLELLLAMIVPVSVGLAIAADVFAGALLGSEFQASVTTLLPLLALGRMCGAVNQFYLQSSFQLAEKPMLQVAHDILILALNIVLFFVLTPIFGLPGTAAAVLIAEALGILIGIGLSRRAFRLPFNGPGVLRVCAATAVMALVVYAARSATAGHGLVTLLCVVGGGALAYAGAAILFDVAAVRTSMAAGFWSRSVPAE